jgi:uncharacterized OB-fold protein
MTAPVIHQPDAPSAAFFAGLGDGRILLQRCRACGKAQFYPRAVCSHCQGRDLEWLVSAGTGAVYSVTTVYRGPSAAFKDVTPYQVALVDMDEGFRFMANVRGGEAEIGTRVRVIYEERGDQTIPQVEIGG